MGSYEATETYSRLLYKATELEKNKKFQEAIDLLKNALSNEINDEYKCIYSYHIADFYDQTNNITESLAYFNVAWSILQLVEDIIMPEYQIRHMHTRIIQYTFRLNGFESALKKIEEFEQFERFERFVFNKNARRSLYLGFLASELIQIKMYEAAITLCRTFLSKNTDDLNGLWHLQYQQALAYKYQGKYEDSILLLLQAKKNSLNTESSEVALNIEIEILYIYKENVGNKNNPSYAGIINSVISILHYDFSMRYSYVALGLLLLLRSILSNPRLLDTRDIKKLNELIDKIIQSNLKKSIKDNSMSGSQNDNGAIQQQIDEFIGIEYLRKCNYTDAFVYFKYAYSSTDNYLGNFNLAYILSNLSLGEINQLDAKNLKEIIELDSNYSTIAKESDPSIFLEFYLHICKIIALSSVQGVEEEKLAHYTAVKNVGYLLPEKSVFRLSSTAHLNDPSEGKTLFSYIKNCAWKEIPTFSINKRQAFIACFSFNHNHLNQFRLYGTTDHRAASGVSLVFKRDHFFKQDRMDQFIINKANNSKNNFELSGYPRNKKYHLFRCIYIDPLTLAKNSELSITLAQRERHTFAYNKEKHLYGKYNAIIRKKTKSIYAELQKIKAIYKKKNIDTKVLDIFTYQLCYLVKDIAFKEEQECRCIGFEELSDNAIVKEEGDLPNKRYFVEAESISPAITKIWIGPQCPSLPIINELVARNGLDIKVEQSQLPIRD